MHHFKRLVWIGLLLGCTSSCNRYVDRQPTPDTGPPPGTVQTLIQQYPQAQGILFTTIASNQLWQATFNQDRQRYRALTSPDHLLVADQLVDGSLADSLDRILKQTVVSGGTYSNPRFRHYTGWFSSPFLKGLPTDVYADYTWQQQSYTVHWHIVRSAYAAPFYNVELLPHQQLDYQTELLTSLPESVQASLRSQNLTFTYAVIQVDERQKRRYTVSAMQASAPPAEQYWQLMYDDDGQLLTAANQATAQFFQRADQLPPAIQQAIQRPELAGFSLGGTYGTTARYTRGSLSTYWVNLQKDKQAWQLIFSDKGQLISRSFLTYGTF